MSAPTQPALGWRDVSRRTVDVHLDWQKAMQNYRAHLEGRQYKASTLERYAKTARRLSRWMQREGRLLGPWEVSTGDLRDFLSASTNTRSSTNELVKTISYFYDWAEGRGLVSPSPATALPRLHLEAAPTPSGWTQAWSDFHAHLAAKGASKGTIDLRRHWIRRFADYCGPVDPFTVRRADLEDWLASAAWSPNTRKAGQSSLRTFYAWAESAGFVAYSPCRDLPSVRVPRPRPRPTPETVIDVALGKAAARERLMVLLASQAGLRAMEIAALHAYDVDFVITLDDGGGPHLGGALHVVGKGGHRRTIPMAPDGELVTALQSWIGCRQNAVFPGRVQGHLSAHYVSRLLSQLLGPNTSGHKLRHRFASVGYAGTRDLRAVQELLGHSKPETTAIYTATVDGSLMDTVVAAARRR